MLSDGQRVRRSKVSHDTPRSRVMPALTTPCNRQFILSAYPVIKKHNPDLPVMIREAQGTPARVFARFGAPHLPHTSRLVAHNLFYIYYRTRSREAR